MPRRNRPDTTDVHAASLPLVRLWMLRALLDCNGVGQFIGDHRFSEPSVARMLGFSDEGDADAPFREGEALQALRRKARQMERELPAAPPTAPFTRNLALIANRLALTPAEHDILHLTAQQHLIPEFGECLDLIGDLSRSALCRLLSQCLRQPAADVQAALHPRGKLSRSALLAVDMSHPYRFTAKVEMLEGLAESLMLPHDDFLTMFEDSFVRGPAPRLGLEDFSHLRADVDILHGYLDAALGRQRLGVNVLVHGRPGTGKTELVRALAEAAGARLLEIPVEAPNGEPRAGRHRFDAYRCAQSLLDGADRHVLVFDEVEDVFCEGQASGRGRGNASGIKGWVNQWLETNPVPTFWITNHLEAIDPAYRRRFDYVLPMDVPPTHVRRRLVDRYVGDLCVSDAWRNQVASHAGLSPGMLERAVRVGTVVCQAGPAQVPELVMSRAMNHSLHAMGIAPLGSVHATDTPRYSLDLLNADCDLARVEAGLRRVGQGRLCLYGPPGTGKTAFGRHLAAALERPLLVKRASDILSPYVGVAEQNIAQMFAEARRDGAVLLVDEADSLLRERLGAQRSWEVTQVNEMLTQMECFDGVFIASTNLMHSLDAASLRRFDALVRLGYLAPGQAWQLYASELAALDLPEPAGARDALARMSCLTPGDFTAVRRLGRLDPPADGTALIARLRQMCDAKHVLQGHPIGFVHG